MPMALAARVAAAFEFIVRAEQVYGCARGRGTRRAGGADTRSAMGARSAIRSFNQPRLASRAARELPFRTSDSERGTLAGVRTVQRHGHADHRAASPPDAEA